ncbi:fusaric acid resistance protein, partial [Zoogloea oleivorans]
LALARNQLAALTGQGPDATLTLTPPALRDLATTLPGTLRADLLGRRPDVIAQRWRVEASGRDSDAARAEFYPNVNLNAFVGLQSLGLGNLLESSSRMLGVGPAIHLPVFDSGRLRANLASRHAEQDAAIAQYNTTLVDALRDVADQLANWRGADAEGRDQQAAQARYEDAWRLTEVRYRAGLSSYTAVLAAETPLLAQRRLTAELRTRRLEASAGLARALGGGYTPNTPSN